MTKFRTLTQEELLLFEQEFREYLAINGIDAEMWKRLKKEEPEKSEKIIEVFADVVFNTVLMKVNYIEHVSTNSLKYFRYDSKGAILIVLEGNQVNFSDKESMLKAIGDSNNKLELYSTSKNYAKTREEEIFDMLKNGCSISDGSMFELLFKVLKKEA